MNSFSGFYKDKKVFITGCTGFKGSWMTQWLLEMGADICGYSLSPPTNPSLFEILELDKHVEFIEGDVRDYDKLHKSLTDFNPDIVFHLAAQPLVRLSYDEPRMTYETNIMGTVNILETVRTSNSVKVFVNVTSDKCYDNKEWIWGYRENDPMGGYDPYSSSKGCSELVTSSYRNSFFNPEKYGKEHSVLVASGRAGNVIGGGDWALDRLVPDFARAISTGNEIIIRNPDATRPWQHVLEPVSGYLLLAERMWNGGVKYCEGWNFGPSDEDVLTVEEIIKLSIKFWEKGSYRVISDNKFHEARLLKLDASKAHFKLGWKAVYNAQEAIEKTIIWYRKYDEKKEDLKILTINQITDFCDKAAFKGISWATGKNETKSDDFKNYFNNFSSKSISKLKNGV